MKRLLVLLVVLTSLVASGSAPAAARLTPAQEQAVLSAKSYLSMGTGFSRAGLIKQLTSSYGEGFSRSLAIFAVNYLHPNWYQQAVLSAKSYLKSGMGFSRASLIQQLSSSYGEGFTYAQAVYAANRVGL
jgi:host cell surface-exposed lipoprotein